MNKPYSRLKPFDMAFSLLLFIISMVVRIFGATASAILEPDEITYIDAGRLYISSLAEGKLFSPWWFNFEHPALGTPSKSNGFAHSFVPGCALPRSADRAGLFLENAGNLLGCAGCWLSGVLPLQHRFW